MTVFAAAVTAAAEVGIAYSSSVCVPVMKDTAQPPLHREFEHAGCIEDYGQVPSGHGLRSTIIMEAQPLLGDGHAGDRVVVSQVSEERGQRDIGHGHVGRVEADADVAAQVR